MKYILNFGEFVKEGLILSYPVKKTIEILKRKIEQFIKSKDIEKTDIQIAGEKYRNTEFAFRMQFKINNNMYGIYSHFIHIIKNLCGYIPSNFIVVYKNNKTEIIKSDIINKKYFGDANNVWLCLKCEAKYENDMYNDKIVCPDKLYHLTNADLNKIKRIGLYPKSKNRKSEHPERIYLFEGLHNWKSMLKMLKDDDALKKISPRYKYTLLEINCLSKKLIIHTDPNCEHAFFAYDNINPKNIKIIKENL